MLEFAELTFDHLRRPDRDVGVQAQSLGEADEQRQCVLGAGVHIVIQLCHGVIRSGHKRDDDVVHLIDDLSQRGHFSWKCGKRA